MLAAIIQRLREHLPDLPVADMTAFTRRRILPSELHAYVLLLAEERETSERAGGARGRMKRTVAVILEARCAAETSMRPRESHPEGMPADVVSPDVLGRAEAIRHVLDGWQPSPSSSPLSYRMGRLVQADEGRLIWMMTFRHDEMLAAA